MFRIKFNRWLISARSPGLVGISIGLHGVSGYFHHVVIILAWDGRWLANANATWVLIHLQVNIHHLLDTTLVILHCGHFQIVTGFNKFFMNSFLIS